MARTYATPARLRALLSAVQRALPPQGAPPGPTTPGSTAIAGSRPGDGRYISGTSAAPPPPPPPSPSGWVNHYDGNNPLGISADSRRSNNYFLILGDWGKFGGPGDCQSQVAGRMKAYIKSQEAQGRKLLFVAVVGDNFYWSGNDPSRSWSTQWSTAYGIEDPASPLFGVPWLAVLGNHDYGDTDLHSACPWVAPMATVGGQAYSSTQMNQDKNPSRPGWTSKYWLPDYSYHYEIPEASLELIAVDQNYVDINGLGGDPSGHQKAFAACGGEGTVSDFLGKVGRSGEDLLRERAAKGSASTVVIIQHYPSRGDAVKQIFDGAVPSGRKVTSVSAFGHTHDQQCQRTNSFGQCDLILTGGGGGCCQDDLDHNTFAGFTAIHLTDGENGGYTADLTSPGVRLEHRGQCRW
eukprot:TRINITY_DN123_c1_g1_i1.p1 TRINITY_DN123_c1_g1~~TRINITY_DN123_c1_g1_i1.p1  ORF type:complete len:408 (+),score=83.98 TRINITY_DN123_c1_g1_i1:169-1392(+)